MTRTSGLGVHRTILLLGGTHLLLDGYANIFPPLLPLLIPRLHLSLALAGTLAMCFQLAASVSQLGFGQLADRWRPRLLLLGGPVVGVAGLSLVGLAGSPLALGAILVLGGLGCAAFHPPAAALAHRYGGRHKGLAMSVYITGGTLGFSLGPLVFAPFAQRYGLHWTPALAVPGLLAVALLLRGIAPMPHHRPPADSGIRALRPYARPLALLYAIVVLRTMTALAFATFVPVLLTGRGWSVGAAGAGTALYLVASGIGGFFGGPAADRLGARRVIAWSLVLATPFLVAAPLLTGWISLAALAVGGLLLQSTLPVNVTFAQTLAPVSVATVSSLMMGFGWGTGGLSAPVVGLLADRIGIERTLTLIALVPLAAAACARPLPRYGQAHAPARAADVGLAEPD